LGEGWDKDARKQAEQARSQAKESAQATESAVSEDEATRKFAPSETLKKLYRDLAKLVHSELTNQPQSGVESAA